MQGSNLIFDVLPIIIPLILCSAIALPFIADGRSGRRRPGRQPMRAVAEPRRSR
jgi:hypothetical protein